MTRTSPNRLHLRNATPSTDDLARCSCGLAFPNPWDLIGHLLAAHPPHVSQSLDDIRHADATCLAVKLAEGPSEIWEVGTWARDARSHLRVAASIAMRSATGDLKPWALVTQQELVEAYHVSVYTARNAIAELTAAGIVGHYGGRNNVIARDIVRSHNETCRTARVLDLVAFHVADLEAEVAALKPEASRRD